MTVGSIVAISPEWVIGLHNAIPWRYPGDQRRFRRVTMGATVIMGRLTWESLGCKPLSGRRNLVVTHHPDPRVECFSSLREALDATLTEGAPPGDAWFIGGAGVYRDAMSLVDLIDVTFVPDHVTSPEALRFPHIDETVFEPGPRLPHEDDPALCRAVYTRRTPKLG